MRFLSNGHRVIDTLQDAGDGRYSRFLPILIFVMLGSIPAFAQQSPNLLESTATDDSVAPMLDAVVVTAQRRPQLDRDVPISMTVLSQDDIEKARGGTLQDIQQLVPGFSFEEQSGFYTLTMRGVGGGGRNIGFDPRVGVYLDGIYMGQAQALRQPLFDVEQVEVLRGPQGHLFGRNTVAGAVNITMRAPTPEFEGSLRTVVGNKGILEGAATVSGPLSDQLLGKLAVATETRAGFGTNFFDGQKLEDLNRYTVRGQILALPSDRLKISLSMDASHSKQKQLDGEPTSDLFGLPLPNGALPKRTVNLDTTPMEIVDLAGVNATANYRMEGGHVLTAIAGYRDTRQIKQMDNDYGPKDLLHTYYVDHFKQSSEEVRVASPTREDFNYVVGLYHLSESATTDRKAFIGKDVATTLVQFVDAPTLLPFGPTMGVSPGNLVSNEGVVTTNTYALFGAIDYRIAPPLTLNLGARYTHEDKNVLFNLNGKDSGAFNIGTLQDYRDSRSENKLSPTIGVTYAVSKYQNVYAKYARGFKSGGWNVEFLSANAIKQPSFNTETVDSYEVGTKGQLAGGRMRYSLAAYTSQFKDFQVFQFVDLGGGATSSELRNAAEAISRGVDADVALRVTRHLDVGVRFGVVNAKFKRFDNCSPTVDCTGHRLPYAPTVTAALTADYRIPLSNFDGRLDVYGEYSHHGRSFSDPVNDPVTQSVPSRQVVNLRIGYTPGNSRWAFSFWVRNLFDKDTVTMRERDFLGNQIDTRLDPRTVGVEAKFNL